MPDHLLPPVDFDQDFDPVVQDGDFDVATYLEVLQHVGVEEGHVLDYVYHFDWMGGFPVLYVRSADEEPFQTADELYACQDTCPAENFIVDLINEDVTGGYMELAVLDVMAGQFYLWWHAGFNDNQLVYDQSSLEEIVSVVESEMSGWGDDVGTGAEFLELLSNSTIDLTPTVECVMTDDNQEAVLVRALTFTKWGGLFRSLWTIEVAGSGKKVVDRQDENLIPYDCGWLF